MFGISFERRSSPIRCSGFWDPGLSPNLSSVSLGKALREVSAKVGTWELACEGSLRRWCPCGPAGERPLEAALQHGSWQLPEEMTRALKKALGAGGGHRDRLRVHLACIFHEETQNFRFSYVHVWRHITRALGTLMACIPVHITSKDPDMCTPLPSHLVTRFLENSSSPGTSCPLLLCPHTPPHSPHQPHPWESTAQGSPGLHRKCFAHYGSARLFSVPELEEGQARSRQSRHSQLFAASFSGAFSLLLQVAVSISPSLGVSFCLCISLSVLRVFLTQCPLLPLSPCLPAHITLQNSVRCHLLQKAFPDPSCSIWIPFPLVPRAPRRMLSGQWAVWMSCVSASWLDCEKLEPGTLP